jgi:hypothetical protein
MAKQTFTTGQVLTAAQMTSLQQTAMLGGAASAKTASYTLVAADAGTAVSMSNAGATTITVNSGLFAAGDTVHITNLGAGVCTITAGTATVNSSASLALAQYESGFLDFTTSSAAIFVKGAGAAPTAGGANFTLLNSGGTALSGSQTVTVSGISGADKILVIIRSGASSVETGRAVSVRINGDTGSNYQTAGLRIEAAGSYNAGNITMTDIVGTGVVLLYTSGTQTQEFAGSSLITGCNSSGVKVYNGFGGSTGGGGSVYGVQGVWTGSATVTSVSVFCESGNFDAGRVFVYTSA